jgi:acetylglutamate kinase
MKQRVVKVGGAHLDEVDYLDELTAHLRTLSEDGPVILVHGGGKEIAALHDALEVPFRKELGIRVTSDTSMDLVAMVLCGLVNKRLVAHLNAAGMNALGVCGADLGLLRSDFLNPDHLGRVGGPPRVDVAGLESLLETTRVLVLSPVSSAPDGALLNVNADVAAQAVAVSMNADCLDFVTDVEGVRTSEGTVRRLAPAQIDHLIETSVVAGGMIPKLQASLAALAGGVNSVRVGSLESLGHGTATEVVVPPLSSPPGQVAAAG